MNEKIKYYYYNCVQCGKRISKEKYMRHPRCDSCRSKEINEMDKKFRDELAKER